MLIHDKQAGYLQHPDCKFRSFLVVGYTQYLGVASALSIDVSLHGNRYWTLSILLFWININSQRNMDRVTIATHDPLRAAYSYLLNASSRMCWRYDIG